MTKAAANGWALWTLPWSMAKLTADWTETMLSARDVIDARVPKIAEAWINPIAADHRELSRMVTEKMDAFGQSHRAATKAHSSLVRASEANARALGRLSGGELLSFGEWFKIVERNFEIATALAVLPATALAPIHARVRANARRLSKS